MKDSTRKAMFARLGLDQKNTDKKIIDDIKRDENDIIETPSKVLALGSGINLTDAKRHEDYYHYAEGHAYSKRPEIKHERK